MNIVETLSGGIQFEIKTSHLYKRILSSQKGRPVGEEIWKEIIAQKEKEIHILKRALQGLQNQGPNASRINLISSKEMEEALAWIAQSETELRTADPTTAIIIKLIPRIVSFELQLIYSPLLKVYDLQFVKRNPQLISLLNRHLQSLNSYLKKRKAPSLHSLAKDYPFLTMNEEDKKGFSEETLYQNLLKQKKALTLRLKNGSFFSGTLHAFDHFSLQCLPLDGSANPVSTLFLKESILSVQIHD